MILTDILERSNTCDECRERAMSQLSESMTPLERHLLAMLENVLAMLDENNTDTERSDET